MNECEINISNQIKEKQTSDKAPGMDQVKVVDGLRGRETAGKSTHYI